MIQFYLASQSPRRRELLKEAGFRFKRCQSHHREILRPSWTTRQNALWNAKYKALEAKTKNKAVWILAADTLVSVRGKILGKPRDLKQARQFLKLLSGSTHRVYTAVVFYQPSTHRILQACELTKVTFKKLSSDEIEHLIHKTNPLDKAGAYAIQEQGDWVVKKIQGSKTNVVGLPMERVKKMFRKISQK